jgi:hypothetical protein
MLFPPSTGRVVSRLTSSQPPPARPSRRRRLAARLPHVSLAVPQLRRLLHLRARPLRTR